MEIPSITTGLKAMGAAAVFGGGRELDAATTLMLAGVGKKLLGGLFKKKKEETLERKFEKVLDERKSLFERVSKKEPSPILNKIKTFIKAMKEGFSKLLTAILAALKTIFIIIKTALMAIAKALFALVKWIGKKILKGLLKSLLKLCKSGALRKMRVRLKVFGRKLKRFVKSPQALAIGAIALGLAGYFSAIFKKEKKEISEIGDEEDKPDALKEETAAGAPPAPPPAPALTDDGSEHTPDPTPAPAPAPGTPTQAAPAPAPAPAPTPTPGTPTQAVPAPAPAAKPETAAPGTPTQAAPAPAPAPAPTPGTPTQAVPVPVPAPAAGTPTPVLQTDETDPLAKNIAKHESGRAGYNAYNKGTVGNKTIGSDKPIDFSKMTIEEYFKRANLSANDPDRLFAVGKYQIIPITMEDAVKHMKLNPKTTYLDPTTQDLIYSQYLIGSKRPNVAAYLSGKSENINAAVLDLAKEFASIGVPYDIPNKNLKKGDSYYKGLGGNKAHHSPEQVAAALTQQRNINVAKIGTTTNIAQTGEMGQAISGTTLASAGPTQYDKDKNTQTNVVIASKTNNRTNNVEERRAA